MNDRFHYDALVDDALRSVVRRVLTQAADKGLPGSHHFYISFRSNDAGVILPDELRAKYPEEMTIVLQHQYWDLIVEARSVRGDREVQQAAGAHQVVPFAALSAFVDPSVRFGLQFDRKDKDRKRYRRRRGAADAAASADKRQPLAGPAGPEAMPESAVAHSDNPAEAKPEDAASKIVKLDNFRKK